MSTLSLCVICKNEEKSIGQLLDSVKGNLFDEIIIVDTGSTDSTLEILRQYNVRIEHFKWINDFSAARNYSFSKASSDYIMWLDSDDYIKPDDYLKLIDLKSKITEYPIWLLKYEYAHDENGRSICSFYRERIIKRSLNLKWEQPIHEYIPLSAPYKQVDIEIQHNKKDVHTARNISILEEVVSKNPTFARNIYYLGKEYFDSGEIDKGCDLLEKFILMPDAWGENKYSAFIRLGEHQMSQKQYSKAKEYLHKALQEDPNKAKAYYHLGDIALSINDYHTAVHWFNICRTMGRSDQSLDVVEPKYHTWLPNLQLCLAYNYIGKVREAAEANERALSFLPEDSRMLNNKSIFIKSLKNDYPFVNGEKFEDYLESSKYTDNFKKKVAWFTSSDNTFASNRIRMQNISETLNSLGCFSEYYNLSREDSYDFIITGKTYGSEHLDLIRKWKSKGITVICDINEDILQFSYVEETLLESDFIVCCSHSFAEHIYASLNLNNVSVIEDAVEYFYGENI